MIRKLPAFALAAAMLAVASPASRADSPAVAPYDVNKPAWFSSFVVQTYARIPKPDGSVTPSPGRRDDTAYLVGNIYTLTPFGGEFAIPGTPFVVPAHDDVFTRWSSAHRPADVFGFWVVPGPAAISTDGDPQQNVRVRPMPAGSLAGAPLAYAVKFDGKWRYLTSGESVERGIDFGLLAAIPSGPGGGFGGIGWLALAVKLQVEP